MCCHILTSSTKILNAKRVPLLEVVMDLLSKNGKMSYNVKEERPNNTPHHLLYTLNSCLDSSFYK